MIVATCKQCGSTNRETKDGLCCDCLALEVVELKLARQLATTTARLPGSALLEMDNLKPVALSSWAWNSTREAAEGKPPEASLFKLTLTGDAAGCQLGDEPVPMDGVNIVQVLPVFNQYYQYEDGIGFLPQAIQHTLDITLLETAEALNCFRGSGLEAIPDGIRNVLLALGVEPELLMRLPHSDNEIPPTDIN